MPRRRCSCETQAKARYRFPLKYLAADQMTSTSETSDCYGATLAPNETCSIQVHFDPNETGFYVAQVRARANNGATFTAEVSGTGGRAVLSGSPNPADFGEATVGSSRSHPHDHDDQ